MAIDVVSMPYELLHLGSSEKVPLPTRQ